VNPEIADETAEEEMMNKRTVVLSVALVAVAIVVGALYFNYPPTDGRNAQGTIGAVKKHQETQIAPKDVVLMDEKQRRVEAMFYGNALEDAAQLGGLSHEVGGIAKQLRDKELAQRQLAVSAAGAGELQAVDSASEKLAQRALGVVEAMIANKQLSAYHTELVNMRQTLASRTAPSEAQMANFESALNASEQLLAQKLKMQEQALAHAESTLSNVEQTLSSGKGTANLEAAQTELVNAAATLQAQSSEDLALAAGVRQLKAQFLQHALVLDARKHLQAVGQLQNAADEASLVGHAEALNEAAESLAFHAVSMENRALANMKNRLAVSAAEANSLGRMAEMVASISKHLANRKSLNAQGPEAATLASFEQSLNGFTKHLQVAENALGMRFLAASQNELAAVESFLNGRAQLAARGMDDAVMMRMALASAASPDSMAMRGIENRKLNVSEQALSSRNLAAAYAEHLNAMSSVMESRKFADQNLQSKLGVQASVLERQASIMESKSR
jgi:hypothetical protein